VFLFSKSKETKEGEAERREGALVRVSGEGEGRR
jgi:hypothetical protein